ncbi:uncharacterized protein LOC111615367 [Centruroides sculpturatus]|uniref:uncharacterized protein LOC111615367 n=1 Tax=Centruroides sculpturatus TaxID=218467 RepID=UPI000C6CAA47|nr:uncharacterized protein LOC111615367 [Centruroides sculpturatus]
MKEVQEQKRAEKETMKKIKLKLDRIRAHQKKRKYNKVSETHYRVIRSGDFDTIEEYFEDTIEFENKNRDESVDREEIKKPVENQKHGFIFNLLITSSMGPAVF